MWDALRGQSCKPVFNRLELAKNTIANQPRFRYNEEYFGDPWVFRPERWIVDPATGVTEDDVTRAYACFNPFSIGVGNCAGQKLAMEEILITIARTLYRMDVRRAPGDTLGGGSSELVWGARNKDHFALKDAYISIRNGPMVQFRKRNEQSF